MQKPDSLIFDMDGTLWDAADTYTESWNLVYRELGMDTHLTRTELSKMIGMDAKKVTAARLPGFDTERQMEIYGIVNERRKVLLAKNGGFLYNGVIDGLKLLSTKYKLFILSNCAAGIIRVFIDWAGIDEYITDEIATGINLMPKHHNIQLLTDRHQLTNPVYIGDTLGDGEESRKAGIPFILVTYGFGDTDDYDLKFDDFKALTAHFMSL